METAININNNIRFSFCFLILAYMDLVVSVMTLITSVSSFYTNLALLLNYWI